jgi:hypothetical protein
MGNEQSAETPRGPRKLSKPPHCSQTSATGLPYDATAVTPHREHFSNSYIVGSLPPPPNKASSLRRVVPGLGIAVQAGEAANPMPSPTCRDHRLDPIPRTRSVQSEQSPRLPSFINSSRTSSIAQDSGYRALTRADRFVQHCIFVLINRADFLEIACPLQCVVAPPAGIRELPMLNSFSMPKRSSQASPSSPSPRFILIRPAMI